MANRRSKPRSRFLISCSGSHPAGRGDPPPYRPSPLLRGPEHLLLEVEEVRSNGKQLAKVAQR